MLQRLLYVYSTLKMGKIPSSEMNMGKVTFWDVIESTIERAGLPLSAREIWDKAQELGTMGDYSTTGKTPWATIAAYCYTDMNKNGEASTIVKTSDRPVQFYLRRLGKFNDTNSKVGHPTEATKTKGAVDSEKKFMERDLHPLLVAYAYGDTHFKANLKTIYQEKSAKAVKGQNEWLHPDLVGVYFPFRDYKQETLEIQNHLSITSVKLYSFELKIALNFGNLRQSYFQAVSNSSWAHEGYLVAVEIDDDPTFKDEVRRLNNAFGIGIIKLNAENIYESDILFPARIKSDIDWDTVNRLAQENSNFNDFLKLITEDCKLGKVKSQYDRIMKWDEIEQYVIEKKINHAGR